LSGPNIQVMEVVVDSPNPLGCQIILKSIVTTCSKPQSSASPDRRSIPETIDLAPH
jgi:hypothetical protein